ncbi:MAG: DUF262 domain-containing protein, partial [Candidatus Margulisiibacteriota bacterium]
MSLPPVQRGFVWKPYQIENLWDSLLRGFPIGAFVLSKKRNISVNNTEMFDLLDGQQRASAICLGFGRKAFKTSQERYRIFIDLIKPSNDNREYIFRVITKSHPWGYQKTDNTKTLESGNITKAQNIYGYDNYLQEELARFFPYDADLPVPFELFIESALKSKDLNELINEIEKWPYWQTVIKLWKNKRKEVEDAFDGEDGAYSGSSTRIRTRIKLIYGIVKDMLNDVEIPALYLDLEKIAQNKYGAIKETQDEESDETDDEIENLFVRLNSEGTPLRGEELNYSILKSHINQRLQEKIEEECKGLFYPSRFITIMYRLFQNKKQSVDAISLRIKPKNFQKTMQQKSQNKGEFEFYLEDVFSNRRYEGKTLLEYTQYILDYDENKNAYGLPYLIKSRIGESAPEIMFMLLYRIENRGDRFEPNSKTQRRMIGMVTLFSWFVRGSRSKRHSKLLSTIWPAVKKLEKEIFWSQATVQRAMSNEALI